VTHADLFFENPVKLPFLNIELPLLAFFFLAPILFVIVHAYTLVHLVFLTDKARRFNDVLKDQFGEDNERGRSIRDSLRRQLPGNIFVQFLAGPRGSQAEPLRKSDAEGDRSRGASAGGRNWLTTIRSWLRRLVRDAETRFRWLMLAIAWATLAVGPVLLLLLIQVQFLPFHNSPISWTHRFALLADLVLVWWLWRKILEAREREDPPEPYPNANALKTYSKWRRRAGMAVAFCVILFSWFVATFPGEWQEDPLPSFKTLLGNEWAIQPIWDRVRTSADGVKTSLHDRIFASEVDAITRRRWLPLSSTLVLPGLNVYEGLKIDDPDKVKGRDFNFRARGRDLRGAIFDLASLPKVDFQGAELQRAFLGGARLQGVSFQKAQLQGASLDNAQLQGASLDNAQLQRAGLDGAQLQGASLNGAQLQGASLNGAQLRGATLDGAQLQAAALDAAQLQGASLKGADLQGASLQEADLNAADLSKPYLWRANLGSVKPVSAVRLAEAGDTWRPHWLNDNGTPQQWTKDRKEDYERWRNNLASFASDFPRRNQVLANIGRLDPSGPEPSEPAEWPKSLKDGRADDRDYARALASELKTLVCWGVDDAIYAFHGNGFQDRLGAAGAKAPAQVDFIDFIDFIMSKDCPVSASLTDADKAKLPHIRKEAAEEAINEAAHARRFSIGLYKLFTTLVIDGRSRLYGLPNLRQEPDAGEPHPGSGGQGAISVPSAIFSSRML